MFSGLFLLACVTAISFACPPIELPRFSSMNCTWINLEVKQCKFECQAGIDMIGSSVLTCKRGAKTWDKKTPICYSDYITCGKRCPPLTNVELDQFDAYQASLTPEQLEAISQIRTAYRSEKLMRSASRSSCSEWMCRIKCPMLKPNKHMIKRCQKCKKSKVIKCVRSGSLFG